MKQFKFFMAKYKLCNYDQKVLNVKIVTVPLF